MSEALFQILASEIAEWKDTTESDETIDYPTICVALGSVVRRSESAGMLNTDEASELRRRLGIDY
jgi:hypothetical protein